MSVTAWQRLLVLTIVAHIGAMGVVLLDRAPAVDRSLVLALSLTALGSVSLCKAGHRAAVSRDLEQLARDAMVDVTRARTCLPHARSSGERRSLPLDRRHLRP